MYVLELIYALLAEFPSFVDIIIRHAISIISAV